jgi:hypothetical protein
LDTTSSEPLIETFIHQTSHVFREDEIRTIELRTGLLGTALNYDLDFGRNLLTAELYKVFDPDDVFWLELNLDLQDRTLRVSIGICLALLCSIMSKLK